jgi:Co/Zn/Cd efflux system component
METEQIKQKMPIGMILILVLVGWGVVSLLFSIFKGPLYQLGPVLLVGAGGIVANLVTAIILATIFYGILKKKGWARRLTIGWYIISIILSLINFVSFLGNKTMYNSYYQKSLSPEKYSLMTTYPIVVGSLLFVLVSEFIFGTIIIIYLARKKDFFIN